jgi:hypothetical protein
MRDLRVIKLAANEDGRLELIALAGDPDDNRVYLWHRWVRRGGDWSDWESFDPLGGPSMPVPPRQQPTVARQKSGELVAAGVCSSEECAASERRGVVALARQERPGR